MSKKEAAFSPVLICVVSQKRITDPHRSDILPTLKTKQIFCGKCLIKSIYWFTNVTSYTSFVLFCLNPIENNFDSAFNGRLKGFNLKEIIHNVNWSVEIWLWWDTSVFENLFFHPVKNSILADLIENMQTRTTRQTGKLFDVSGWFILLATYFYSALLSCSILNTSFYSNNNKSIDKKLYFFPPLLSPTEIVSFCLHHCCTYRIMTINFDLS